VESSISLPEPEIEAQIDLFEIKIPEHRMVQALWEE
jgi:hypothetical protein